jgi:hypothetical protein
VTEETVATLRWMGSIELIVSAKFEGRKMVSFWSNTL